MVDNTNGIQQIESYFTEVERFDWFAKVGCGYPEGPGIRSVDGWEESYKWTIQPITEWCDLEAKQRIYRYMSASHYDEFVKWNEVASSILPAVERLVEVVRQHFPTNAPSDAADWFQCQLIGASMEIYYARFYDSTLYRDQLSIYQQGYFPCGWYVESEALFPDQAVVVVY